MSGKRPGFHPLVGTSEGWPVYTPRPWPEGVIEETYDYVDAAGRLLFQVVRFRPKSFMTKRTLPDGSVKWGPRGLTPALYRLPGVVAAHTIVLLEGEKDVGTAERLGLPPGWAASCNPYGAGMWRNEYTAALAGKRVVFCPDTDVFGQTHLRIVAPALVGHATEMSIIRLPAPFKDLSEWAEAGGGAAAFAAMLRDAEPLDYPKPDSDRRLITGELTGALDRLLALRGVRDPAGDASAVFLPEEVASVFPGWVGEQDDGSQFVAITGFEPLLALAMREIKQNSAGLASRLDAVEARLAARLPPPSAQEPS